MHFKRACLPTSASPACSPAHLSPFLLPGGLALLTMPLLGCDVVGARVEGQSARGAAWLSLEDGPTQCCNNAALSRAGQGWGPELYSNRAPCMRPCGCRSSSRDPAHARSRQHTGPPPHLFRHVVHHDGGQGLQEGVWALGVARGAPTERDLRVLLQLVRDRNVAVLDAHVEGPGGGRLLVVPVRGRAPPLVLARLAPDRSEGLRRPL